MVAPAAVAAARWRGGQRAGPVPGHPLQRRTDRPDRAQVGAGPDHHGRTRIDQSPHRGGQVRGRHRPGHHVGDVVGPDDDHGDVRARGQASGHLAVQVGRASPHDRMVGHRDRLAGGGGRPADEHAGHGVGGDVGPQAGGHGVTQQGEAHRPPRRRPDAAVLVGGHSALRADGPTGRSRLRNQDAEARRDGTGHTSAPPRCPTCRGAPGHPAGHPARSGSRIPVWAWQS